MKTAIMLFLFISLAALAGWDRTYGGSGNDEGYSAVVLEDGSFVVAGYTRSFGAGYDDVYLVKADSLGDTLWTKTYGGAGYDRANFISKTPDGGFIITGYTNSGAIGESIYLLKTDENGDTLWTRTLEGNEGNCVRATSDSGYIIAGTNAYEEEAVVIKTDSIGNTLWRYIFYGSYWCDANCVVETYDGGYFACGHSICPVGIPERTEEDSMGVLMIRLGRDGDTLWVKTIGHSESYCYSGVQTLDSGFVVTGFGPTGWHDSDINLLKVNSEGDSVWVKGWNLAGFDAYEITKCVIQLSDGGFAITGYYGYCIPFLIRTDSEGESLWIRTYDYDIMDCAYTVSATPDGGFLIAGYGRVGGGDYDICVIKTDSLGHTAIAEAPAARPEEIAISAYPNPFNSAVTISFDCGSESPQALSTLPPGACRVEIFDINGRMVAEIPADNPVGSRPASTAGDAGVAPTVHEIVWQPDVTVGSGVYLVRAKVGDSEVTKRVVYLK